MMVAAVSETTNRNQTRPPLLPAEKDNGISAPNKSIRPKPRQVTSRYLSPSPSTSSHSYSNSNSSSLPTLRRSPSPLISRNSTTPTPKRSVSADRRRPTRPDLTLKPSNAGGGAGEASGLSAATKLLVTSTRSLSVSFQGEAFSLPISKTKVTPQSPNVRKGTPERKRTTTPLRTKVDSGGGGDHIDNAKLMDQHRWPGRIRQANATVLSKRLSLECGTEKNDINYSGNVIRASHQSNIDLDTPIDLLNHFQRNPDGNLFKDSDTDSVSSGSTSGIQENGGLNRSRIGPRGIIVSPKFWQETNSRIRRLQDPSAPLSTSPKSKFITPQKPSNSKRFMNDSPFSSPRTTASPNRMRPSSPSKFVSSPRTPGSKITTNFSETPSVLSFAVDVRRGKVGENRFFDAHLLRILYNRQLQWRFVNARSEDIVSKQKHSVEENLWNAWITISDLRDSVTKKRHRLQLLRQKLKLASILKAQIIFLEDWAYLDKDHSISLVGAIEALKASTLRLPVGEGATADLQSMKDAINSALNLVQAMGSSTRSLCLQVGEVNVMVAELAKVVGKERALLRNCKDFLSVLSTLKVKDCSLRTHMLQTRRA